MVVNDDQPTYVYFIAGGRSLVKIGKSRDVRKRLWGLQSGSPVPLRLLASVYANGALERHYHRAFADTRQNGEWFKRSPQMMAEIRRLTYLTMENKARWSEHIRLMEEWGVIEPGVYAAAEREMNAHQRRPVLTNREGMFAHG